MIKILIVDDSPIFQKLYTLLFRADPELRVIGIVNDGAEALAFVANQRPDVILMDLQMPVMNGYEATRRIMETDPIPIVICSASSQHDDVNKTFQAVEAGAVAFLNKPAGPGHPDFQSSVANMIQTIKLMAEIKQVKRMRRPAQAREEGTRLMPGAMSFANAPRVVAIGASTGGPLVLQTILGFLPRNYPVPLLIVQHIAEGFVKGFAEWLGSTTGFPIHIAEHNVRALPGHVYLAPDNLHLGMSAGGTLVLSGDAPENGLRPAVSYLFRSVALTFGPSAVGVLLTGMGKDGAQDLKQLKERGGITIAQDKESSLIHGMPGEAIRLEAALHVLPPEKISALLVQLVNSRGVLP
ncbi:MAG: chemotaxis-specific protein-glutamate methyltransferase CheB [bacterium]